MAVLGGLLVVGALLSSVAKRSFLSLTALFVVAGFLLGEGGVDVLHFNARSGFVYELALVAPLNENGFTWWTFILQDVGLGLVYGAAIGLLASLYVPTDGAGRALYALGAGIFAYGITVLPPHGNGFISVFVCAIVLGV